MHLFIPYKGSISTMNMNEFGFIVIACSDTTGKVAIQLDDRSLDVFGAQMGRHFLPPFPHKVEINFILIRTLSNFSHSMDYLNKIDRNINIFNQAIVK